MSIAIINASVGGTLTVSGTTTLSSPLLSNSRGDFSGLNCNGNAVISGNINLTTFNLVAGATTITNAQLGYLSGATSNLQTQLGAVGATATTALKSATNIWTGVNTFSTSLISSSSTYLNDSAIFLRSTGDTNTLLQYNATVNGPTLQGLAGGRLGITTNPTILAWNSTSIDMNVIVAINNSIRLNTNTMFLKTVGDNNHYLNYNATSDGPALIGFNGGRLGTTNTGGRTDVLTWNSTSGINTVSVSGNTVLTGNVNLLPYTSNTTLSAYTLNCNSITCLGQIVAGGVGIVAAKLQCSNNGTGILGLQVGSFQASTNATQTVTFPNTFLGVNNPLVFCQVVYSGIGYSGTPAIVVSSSLTNFTYNFSFDGPFVHAESSVLIYWTAYQI